MLVETRQFQSKSGNPVPLFLSDKRSPWHKQFANFDQKFEMGTFESDVDSFISTSNEMAEFELTSDPTREDPWNMLGLKAFKVPNVTQSVFNILSSAINNKETIAAEYHENSNSLRPYMYQHTVESNVNRTAEDKAEVRQWLKDCMPPKPKGINGFPKGSAAAHFGTNHTHVLERVLSKSDQVRRLEPSVYEVEKVLQTDQETMDSLSDGQIFTVIANSVNVGKQQ